MRNVMHNVTRNVTVMIQIFHDLFETDMLIYFKTPDIFENAFVLCDYLWILVKVKSLFKFSISY